MLKKEQILKTLKKYGFYSLNRAPYLYQNKNNEFGIYFIWPNNLYGNLERVMLFSNEEELEEEVYKYWWFINNKNKIDINIEFDNYEIINPQVIYKYNNTVLTAEMMKEFTNNEKIFKDEKDIIKKNKLIRTSKILLLIMHEKVEIQQKNYTQVLELQDKLKIKKELFNKKLYKYNKTKEENLENYDIFPNDYEDKQKFLDVLDSEISSLNTLIELRKFIKKLINILREIDSKESYLQNIYLLNRYPIEIEDIENKIKIVDEFQKLKRRIFKPKRDINIEFQEINENSECSKMINVNVYISNEKKEIQEKYNNCKTIDENILGDYILSFEKLDIKVPEMIGTTNSTFSLNKTELLNVLKEKYNKLSKKEKSACHVAASFMKKSLNTLLEIENINNMSTNEVINSLVLNKKINSFNDDFTQLDNYLNTKVRVKYLNILKVNSFENFVESLIETAHILKEIKVTLNLDRSFISYYNVKNNPLIFLSLKKFSYLEQDKSYVAKILPGVPIYYSPVQINKSLDIIDNDELVINNNDIVFLLKDNILIETSKKNIKVVKYEKDKIIKMKDYIILNELKEKNACIYYEDTISN